MHSFRSSRPKVFCKKGVLRNFAKFIGKHLCQSLIGVELSIKYFGIKPRLDGGSSALKFLLHVRKGVIFLKKCLPLPSLMVLRKTNSSLSSSRKVISETSLHKTCYENKPKNSIFLKYRPFLCSLNGS